MKKFIFLLNILIIFLLMTVMVSAQNSISVYYNGTQVMFDVEPQTINGRTMVPIRAVFEMMGAIVNWDSSTNTAVCSKGDTLVKMTVNSTTMYINQERYSMDVSPVVIDGRTLAPARYVAEAFGNTVAWSDTYKNVVICSKDVYAYADYPDIPDLGKCYNISPFAERFENGYRVISYVYSNMADEYDYLYDNSALKLGNYDEVGNVVSTNLMKINYTKQGEQQPRFHIMSSFDAMRNMLFDVYIPDTNYKGNIVTLYALDGRTIDVYESEVEEYLNVGWYRTLAETKQTVYAPDGRTLVIYKSEVGAYKNVGWYESYNEAMAANKTSNKSYSSNNPSADGNYYRTPTGKKYHLDPNCGGKNSYRTTNISGLSPCSKCAK